MAVRRSSSILCASVFAFAIGAFKVADLAFIGSKAATRTSRAARYYESGKLDHMLPNIMEYHTGIKECMVEECSVEEMMNSDEQRRIACYGKRISEAMADVKAAHMADVASLSKDVPDGSALAWYDNFVQGMRTVHAEAQAKQRRPQLPTSPPPRSA